MQIIVRTAITDKTFREFMNFHTYKRSRDWLKVPICCLLIVLFGICNFVANVPLLGAFFLIAAVYLFFSRLIYSKAIIKQNCTSYGLGSAPKLFYVVTLSPDGISVKNEKEKATYPWDRVYHAYRLPGIIYLYMNKQTAFLLPFDCLEKGTPDSLWELICKELPSEKLTERQK